MNADVKLPPLFRSSLNIIYIHEMRQRRGRENNRNDEDQEMELPLPYARASSSYSSCLKWGSVIKFYEQLQHLLNIAIHTHWLPAWNSLVFSYLHIYIYIFFYFFRQTANRSRVGIQSTTIKTEPGGTGRQKTERTTPNHLALNLLRMLPFSLEWQGRMGERMRVLALIEPLN